jgi:hypothetical protein
MLFITESALNHRAYDISLSTSLFKGFTSKFLPLG